MYHRVINAYSLLTAKRKHPSNILRCNHLVSRLLAIITSFFTNRIVDKRIAYPPPGFTSSPPLSGATFSFLIPVPISTGIVDVDLPIQIQTFHASFSDLHYLAHTSQALIASLPTYLHQFATTCRLFMCLNPNKRAVNTHVEYETDAWISVFNVTLSFSRVIKVYEEAFGRKAGRTSWRNWGQSCNDMHHIFMVCTLIKGLS